jgi:putative transposase
MANTYTQFITQYVFAVKRRKKLITEEHREELQKYMTGILRKYKHKVYAIYCMPDHTHIVVSPSPDMSPSEIMRLVKSNSSKMINENHWCKERFEWQKGYGGFSYSQSHKDRIVKYVLNQKKHHDRVNYEKEYRKFLDLFEIEYNEKYLFDE